jgi:hypothetical protein
VVATEDVNIMAPPRHDRRILLRGLGGALVAAPFLSSVATDFIGGGTNPPNITDPGEFEALRG